MGRVLGVVLALKKTRDRIVESGCFIIYGHGSFGKHLSDELKKKYGLEPLYFVVTKKDNTIEEGNFDNIFELNEKKNEIIDNNILVIVAVSLRFQGEIETNLKKTGISNVLMFSNISYSRLDYELFSKLYVDLPREGFLERICDFSKEITEEGEECFELGKRTDISDELVSFVVINHSPRVVKLAEAIKKKGRRILCYLDKDVLFNPVYVKFYKALLDLNIQIVMFESIEELAYKLITNKSCLIHVFSQGSYPYVAYMLVKHKKIFGTVVFENYDLLSGYYLNIDINHILMEQYLLEHADGVVYREFDLDYITHEMGISVTSNNIRIVDGCLDNRDVRTVDENKVLELCYVGGVVTNNEYPDSPMCISEMADLCKMNNCHLHVYPSELNNEKYKDYIMMQKTNVFFHFHDPLPYDVLINEISSYDYGVFPMHDTARLHKDCGYNTGQKYIDAMTNKYFDYLDAGLPIIAVTPEKICNWLAEQGVLIPWTIEEMDFVRLKEHRMKYKKRVPYVRGLLNVQKLATQLLGFYENIRKDNALM